MKNLLQTGSKKVTLFFLIFAISFGTFVRIYPLLRASFPLVDGGMFYTMIRDLQASHFTLPVYTSYNQTHIPYAYPPLAFYISGLLNAFAGISLFEIIKWQPVVVNILSIPIFYIFVRQLLGKKPEAALATFIFVVIPNSYWWQIVGGGLTRTLGGFFFLLTAYGASRMYYEKKTTWILFTILAGSLVVLSHLEWALQAATAGFIFWIFWGRNRRGVFMTVAVIVGIMIVTLPWWGTVIQRHGIGIFYRASQVTYPHWSFWEPLLNMTFTREPTGVIAILALVGFFIQLARKEYLLPTWLLLALMADPRGGLPASVVPASLLAMTTISIGIAPQLVKMQLGSSATGEWIDSLKTTIGRFFWCSLIILLLTNAFFQSFLLSNRFLGTEELNALQWVKSHTTPSERFLILEWENAWALSPLLEWFPALTDRRSITTIQGTEWLAGDNGFVLQGERFSKSHLCLYDNVSCLDGLTKDPAAQFDYVILSLKVPGAANRQSSLFVSLENSTEFQMIHSSPGVKIFQVVK
jgi:hypothetical protein